MEQCLLRYFRSRDPRSMGVSACAVLLLRIVTPSRVTVLSDPGEETISAYWGYLLLRIVSPTIDVCGRYCLRQAHFDLPGDVFVLVLAESVAQGHPEALHLSEPAACEMRDFVRGDYGYIVLAHAPVVEGEPAEAVVVKSE